MVRELAYWEAIDLYRQFCREQGYRPIAEPDEPSSELTADGYWCLRNSAVLVARVDCRTGDVLVAPASDAVPASAPLHRPSQPAAY